MRSIGGKAEKVPYRLSSDQLKDRLQYPGLSIDRFLPFLETRKQVDPSEYQLLKQEFDQQFEVDQGLPVLTRDPKKISAQTIQSPHDPDAP